MLSDLASIDLNILKNDVNRTGKEIAMVYKI